MAKKNNSKTPSQRQLKVGEELRHALSETFMRGDFYDPDTNVSIKVTVSEVRISPDLRNATVYVMPFGGKNKEKVMKQLHSISTQVRTIISSKVRLRHMPVFTFRLDKSFDEASEIENLLKKPEVQRDLIN